MKCPTCGQENRAGATFCANCGANLAPPRARQPFGIEGEPEEEAAPPPPDLSLGIPTVKLERPGREEDRAEREAEPVAREPEPEAETPQPSREPGEEDPFAPGGGAPARGPHDRRPVRSR